MLAQTHVHWELLIIDDGCTDETLTLVERFLLDDRICLLKTAGRCGPAKARNKAIAQAKGCLIAFLDSDDLWMPDKLAKQIAFMNEKESFFSFTAYKKIDMSGGIGSAVISVPPKVRYHDLLQSNHIGCLTVMFDRTHFGQVLMPEMGRREDYRLWLNFLRAA